MCSGSCEHPCFPNSETRHPLAPSRASPLRPAVWRSCRPLPGARKPEGVCRWVGGELSLLSDFKGRPTCLVLPGTLMARALRVPDPRKPLNPGRTRTVGHLNCFIRSLTEEFSTLWGSRGAPVTARRFVCPGSGARPAGSDPDFAPVQVCGLRHLGFSASQRGRPQYLPHSAVVRASVYTGKALVANEPFMSCYAREPGMALSFQTILPGTFPHQHVPNRTETRWGRHWGSTSS